MRRNAIRGKGADPGVVVERFERFDATERTALLRVLGRWNELDRPHLLVDDGCRQRRVPPLPAIDSAGVLGFPVDRAEASSSRVAFALVDARGSIVADLPPPVPGRTGGAPVATRAMTMLGRAVSRDASYYTVAMAAVFPLGIASALVATAYLPPDDYGRLGLLMILAGLLTILYGLGTLQGTLMRAYGSAGADGDAEGAAEELGPEELPPPTSRERRRRIMGDGMVLTMLVAGIGTLLVVPNASTIAGWLGGSQALREAVIWAGLSAALGALWRLALQVYRMERRAPMYLAVSISRPLLALVLSFLFLSAGAGVEGVIAATALATAASLALAIGAAFHSYALGLRGAQYGAILRTGSPYIPVITLLWVIGNADLYLLSRFAPAAEVGLYRLGSRLGVFPSYVTSAYLMAWAPMQRTSVFAAATQARSRAGVKSTMFTYLCLGSTGLIVLLAVASELFVALAPAAYADAAPFVPAIAAGVAAQGVIYALYRIGSFRRRRTHYVISMAVAALILAVASSVLANPLGGYGVALGSFLGAIVGSAIMVRAIGRGREPLPFEWGRIGVSSLLGAACVATAVMVPLDGVPAAVLDVLMLFAFPAGLLITGVIDRDRVRELLAVARAAFPVRAGRRMLVRRVMRLDPPHRAAVVSSVSGSGAREPITNDIEFLSRVTHGLRRVVGRGKRTEHDERIGAYLLFRGSNFDRDQLSQELIEAGVDPLELHLLDDALQTLRQVPARVWHGVVSRARS